MSPPSKVSRLPRKQREKLDTMVLEGSRSNQEMLAHANSANPRGSARISRHSMYRYARQLRSKMERYREAQQIAAVWVDKLGQEPEGNVGRLLLEMLRMVAFRQLAEMGDLAAKQAARPAQIALLAKAIRELETASKTIAERDSALREKLRTDVDRKAEQMKRPGAPGDVATLEKAKQLVRGLL